MEIRDMESKDYPEIDRLMKELHELHVKGRPDLYTELEHPYSQEEFEKIVDNPETIAIVSQEEGKVTGLCIGTLRKKSGMVEMRTLYMDDLVVEGCYTAAFLGKDGGTIKNVVDLPIIVKSNNTPRIQECHIFIGHTLCELVEKEL